jgi:hypothetical protein
MASPRIEVWTATLVVCATASLVPTPVGSGRAYRPAALSPAVRAGAPVHGLRCRDRSAAAWQGAHLEVFARRRVVIVPAGIGIAPPQRHDGPYVPSGRCSYAVRTVEPTGLLELDRRVPTTLGQLFALWGQPLSPSRLAGFRGVVHAYIAGCPWTGLPGAIPLRRHAQIVLEVGGYVPPHSTYRFPRGL